MQVLIISTNKIDVIVLPLNDRGRRSSFILGFFESPSIGWIYNFNLDIGSCESATSIFRGCFACKNKYGNSYNICNSANLDVVGTDYDVSKQCKSIGFTMVC